MADNHMTQAANTQERLLEMERFAASEVRALIREGDNFYMAWLEVWQAMRRVRSLDDDWKLALTERYE